jgi:type I restriction enzyme M protein
LPVKKSELYSSIWKGCDELRGGMDASQYKDYVLVLLFVKYVSDKYSGDRNAPIQVPQGGSFNDMVDLIGKKDIGDKINTIISKLAAANDLKGIIDVADFNNEDQLGKGKEMQDRLSKLVGIFNDPGLDFSKNKAEGDDLLGDAYEYLMRNFATESGKSKGQFYTPAEVSRIMAKVIGINQAKSKDTTLYDPTCGSGSLLLKAADETLHGVTIYGQEKDVSTAALAKMNMILHNVPDNDIQKGQSTLSNPLFLNANGTLKTFDFVVANPPFSYKAWSTGFDPVNDLHERFKGFGIPPNKNGDYAFLLHIIRSIKNKGKGACILPHGVLFRGNAEAEIRQNLIRRGYIKGIIGLPANLFYGTGIPACIVVLDKENAESRRGLFMIDASKGFIKDGNKNRLRHQDIHKIVDVFNNQIEIPKYSRMITYSEIEKNEYNLNIPRYIDSSEPEDIQDIEAHLKGDIPNADIEALQNYWNVYPSLKNVLFTSSTRSGYSKLNVDSTEIKNSIFNHAEFLTYREQVDKIFNDWKKKNIPILKNLSVGSKPKVVIHNLSEDILQSFTDLQLIDKYDIYQHIMIYWSEVMQDDVFQIGSEGWKAEFLYDEKRKDYECDLLPKQYVINRYFTKEKEEIENLESEREAVASQMEEMVEEQSGEDGLLEEVKSEKGKVTKVLIQKRIKAIEASKDSELAEELKLITEYLALIEKEAALKKKIKEAEEKLIELLKKKYKTLTETELKDLVVNDKWMTAIGNDVKSDMDRISQRLTQRIKELAERYQIPLPNLNNEVEEFEKKVNVHLQKMGFKWN